MNATPDQRLDRIAVAVRGNLPPGISPAYLDGFLARHRRTLVGVLERELRVRRTGSGADKRRVPLTADDHRLLAGYSGWGGLFIDKVRDPFPAGFPAPEARGLIHEYYTPSKVTSQ